MRPINGKWQGNPGNFDPLHALELQESDNPWGIPSIKADGPLEKPNQFVAYDDWRSMRNRKKDKPPGRTCVHFFMDDYRFEPVWRAPIKAFVYLDTADFVLAPDFSLFRDHPLALQMWNVYRSRWVGAYWQSQGATVIPTVCWSDSASYAFAFLGLPKRATLAVATVGTQSDPTAKHLFEAGFAEMVRQLQPTSVWCYGERIPEHLHKLVEIQTYKPWQLQLRAIDERKKQAAIAAPDVAKMPRLPEG